MPAGCRGPISPRAASVGAAPDDVSAASRRDAPSELPSQGRRSADEQATTGQASLPIFQHSRGPSSGWLTSVRSGRVS